MEPNIPVGLRGGRRRRHEAGGRRRRARAARGRQRQVGGALEDGPHRAAGLGAGGRGQPARPRLPAASPTRAADAAALVAARAGAAHRARRARPAERRAAVRQRLRPGLPGGGAQARRLLRQRRRPLPDGGHGDRRDPPEHPLGVAAQGRAASPRTTRRRACAPATPSTPALFARLLDEEYDKLRAAGDRDVHDDSKTTTLPIAREIVEAYVADAVKAPWYIDLLNLNLDNHDLAVARQRIARLPRRVRAGRHAHHREPRLRRRHPAA